MFKFRHVVAFTAVVGLLAARASKTDGAILYSSGISAPSSTTGTFASPQYSSNSGGIGDDYSTNYTSINLTGFKFDGGLQGDSDPTTSVVNFQLVSSEAMVFIDFYNSTGVLVATLAPASIGPAHPNGIKFQTTGVQTEDSADFGAGVTIPGNGFIIFTPYNHDPTRTAVAQFDIGESNLVTSGRNNSLLSATSSTTSVNGSLVTTVIPGFNFGTPLLTPQILSFELDGSGTGLIPEPVSLALVAPSILFLRRRR